MASSLTRMPRPTTAVVGFSQAKLPPSIMPLPVMVRRIGMPRPASVRAVACSSPWRMRGAMRLTMAPPRTANAESRVYTDLKRWPSTRSR